MARLEYRLLHNPAEMICHYDPISIDELLVRNDSDWFIRGGTIYERHRTEEEDGLHLIYVIPTDTSIEQSEPEIVQEAGFVVEIRQFANDATDYPLLHVKHCSSLLEVLLLLQTETIKLNGRKWSKTSFELDEDRKMFVYYARTND